MNAGPGGFAHAPVSKGLVLGAIGASVISNAARASHRRLPKPLVLLSQVLAFKSPGELLFGCVLLYYFRVLERQSGSRTYGTYAAVVTGLSCALQLGLSRLLHIEVPLAVGPLPLVFASFVPFMFDIPGSSHFSVLGWTMSDKAFIYLAGLQLLLTSGRKSLLVLAASGLAGLLYKFNFCHIRNLRLPSPLVQAVSRLLGPLLTDPRSSGPSVILVGATPSGPGAPAAAAQQSDAYAFAEGFYGSGAGPRHRGPPAGSAEADVGRPAAGAAAPSTSEASEEALEKLLAMGFTRERAAHALQQSNNNLEVAIALLLG
eukprot:gene1734-2076_t